jgi:hypothetical protein
MILLKNCRGGVKQQPLTRVKIPELFNTCLVVYLLFDGV